MNIVHQIIQLLSEPPGSLMYHLLVLFSVQGVFAFSYVRLRRERDDDLALRMTRASAALVLTRLALVLTALYLSPDGQQAANVLPPLELAIMTASAAIIVWGLAPRPLRAPHSLDLALVIVLATVAVGYLFFAQSWSEQLQQGDITYNSTMQATAWAAAQIALLLTGLALTLRDARARTTLRPAVMSVLLLSAVFYSWGFPQTMQTLTNAPYWLRLGYLIAMPLWAVFAFQYALSPILNAARSHRAFVSRSGDALVQSAEVIATTQTSRRLVKGLNLVSKTLRAPFVAFGHVDEQSASILLLRGILPGREAEDPGLWQLDLGTFATFQLAIQQGQSMQLQPNGVGARQLHQFYKRLGIPPLGAILIQPLTASSHSNGLMLACLPEGEDQWPEEELSLSPGLANFVSQALLNSRRIEAENAIPESEAVVDEVIQRSRSVPSAIFLNNAQLRLLQRENTTLRDQLAATEKGRQRAENRAEAATQQARHLAELLHAKQERNSELDEVEKPTEDVREVIVAESSWPLQDEM